jgi:hypothetical protein
MAHSVENSPAERVLRRTTSRGRPWARASTGVLLGAIAEGRADALAEFFSHHGAAAVEVTLAYLLEAGGDEAAVLSFLRRAAAIAQTEPRGCEHQAVEAAPLSRRLALAGSAPLSDGF